MSATMAIECRSFPCWKQDSVSSMPAKSPQLVPLTASSQRSHLAHRLHDLSTKRPLRPRSIRLPKATPPTPLNLADPNRSYWRCPASRKWQDFGSVEDGDGRAGV